MKTLANCKPSEFLRQTNRIKKAVEKYVKDINLQGIRAKMPELKTIPIEASTDERAAIIKENNKRLKEQSMKNLSEILDAAMDKFPEETLEILALVCFVEPEHVDDHSVAEYLSALAEIMNDEAVVNFFTSFLRWGQMNTERGLER